MLVSIYLLTIFFHRMLVSLYLVAMFLHCFLGPFICDQCSNSVCLSPFICYQCSNSVCLSLFFIFHQTSNIIWLHPFISIDDCLPSFPMALLMKSTCLLFVMKLIVSMSLSSKLLAPSHASTVMCHVMPPLWRTKSCHHCDVPSHAATVTC